MQRALVAVTTLLVWASPTLALRLFGAQQNHTPGAHLQNLAGESFDVNQPGDHVLLRVPPDSKTMLFKVSGNFVAEPESPCAMHTSMVTLKGDWLGNQTLRVSLVDGVLHMKVSSSSPAYAGPWRSIQNYSATKGPRLEVLPDTLTILKEPNNTGFAFYAGPGRLKQRPVIKVKHGLREGLDVFVSNVRGFQVPKVGGLLGSQKHNKTLEVLSHECASSPEGMRKAMQSTAHAEGSEATQSTDHLKGSEVMQSTHLHNLLHEKFTIHKPGEFHLLRVPKDPSVSALVKVKGTFVKSSEAPCVVFLQAVTLMGKWFGNKTVHLSTMDGMLGIKVSSTVPAFAGKFRSVKEFFERNQGPEALPATVKITTLVDGPASFRLEFGPKKLSDRASVLVTQTPFGGLNIGISHMERTEQQVIGGLLGMEEHEKSLVTPSGNCKGHFQPVDVPKVNTHKPPTPGAGSLLNASWTA